mgnify:CR=1 FL=1|tara:strand:- start:1129 stop:2037 length:909 start_codon:yes stop_codon:yes gene_type:complete
MHQRTVRVNTFPQRQYISKGLTVAVVAIALLAAFAAAYPFVFSDGPGPSQHLSVRGEAVTLYGYGPYRHMPAEIAIQGLAQDLVTLFIGAPALLAALFWARTGSRAGLLALIGTVGYFFVQYMLYLAMATYNEFFLVWVALVLLTSQTLLRLVLALPVTAFALPKNRFLVGGFLLANGVLITSLWLSVIVPPLLDGSLYPVGLAHLTTMVVQGFDLALFIPPSLIAGYACVKGRAPGALLAPAYSVFLMLQMTALLAKIVWMTAAGAAVGPALIIIPALLVGATVTAALSLRTNFTASGATL